MPVWVMISMAASVTTVLLNSFRGRLIPARRRRPPEVRQVTLEVSSVHCEGCVAAIRDEKTKLSIVVGVAGDPEGKQIVVRMRNGAGQVSTTERPPGASVMSWGKSEVS